MPCLNFLFQLKFFDIKFFNSDTVKLDDKTSDFYALAEMYFRLDID